MGKDAVFTYFRESDPRFKDLQDRDLESFIRSRYPQFTKELDAGKASEIAATRPKLEGTAKQAAARGLGIQVEQTAAAYQQDVANAKSKVVSDVATAIPVAATLATGGMAAPLAMGVMAGAGASAGAYTEAAKLGFGSQDAAESLPQIARRLGVDAALGATAEGGVRLTGTLLHAAGKSFWEPMITKAAARSDQGQSMLNQYGEQQLNQIRTMLSANGAPLATIQPEIDTLMAHLKLSETGNTKAFKQAWSNIMQKVRVWEEGGSQASGVVKLKGDISQIAYDKSGMHFTEKNALEEFANQLDRKAGKLVRQYGGDQGAALYEGYKETAHQLHRYDAGLKLGESFAKRFSYRTAYGYSMGAGGVLGGAQGYSSGGDAGSVIKGAAIGAAVGATAETAMMSFEKYVAPALLQHILADKAAAPLAKKAIAGMVAGDAKGAAEAFSKAASQIGAKEWLQQAFQQYEETQAQKRNMAEMARTPAPKPMPTPTPSQ